MKPFCTYFPGTRGLQARYAAVIGPVFVEQTTSFFVKLDARPTRSLHRK
jgi:hypothetical protein